MSPDIEWHVGEDAEQETIAKVTSGKPVRWRKPIMLLMAALGLGLGALYTAIPEPVRPIAPPVSTVTFVTATPPPPRDLAPIIEREARALASGDMRAFIASLDPDDFEWRQEQISSYTPWGPPSNEAEFYDVLSGQIELDRAWVDVVQARDGRFFRETRFYRRLSGSWVRTRPAPEAAWWGDTETLATRYFQITHPSADAEPARLLAGYLATQSRETCRVFGCNFDERPPVVNFIIQRDTAAARVRAPRGGSTMTVTLPSTRLAGYYAADFGGSIGDDERWTQYFDRYLYFPLLFTAIGGPEYWSQGRNGLMYLYAVGLWDLARRDRALAGRWTFPFQPALVTETLSLSADELWLWPEDAAPGELDLKIAHASALVQFIDETYGSNMVIRFFRTLRFARSLTHSISRLGVPYDEFEAAWLAWSGGRTSARPAPTN
jgi:hypothetical protein